MAAHPELIEPVTEAQMAQIAALVEGVEPEAVVEVDDRRRTRLYCYLPAGPAYRQKSGITGG